MNRAWWFSSLSTHAWYKKIFKRLSKEDLENCLQFIHSNRDLDKNEFEKKVNRMFLDTIRPKAWKEIMELISASNTLAN